MTDLKLDFSLVRGDLHLDVALRHDGGPLALVGPNGSGKTSLLQTLVGALEPSQGRISVGGEVWFDSSKRLCAALDERRVGYLPQGSALFSHMSVLDNVAFAVPRVGTTKNHRRDLALEFLSRLGCETLAPRRAWGLSGGERQKAALARALARSPRLLLLDEPFSALDVVARREMRTFFREKIAELGVATLLVTHDRNDLVALGWDVAVMEKGRVLGVRCLQDWCESHLSPFGEEFFGVNGG